MTTKAAPDPSLESCEIIETAIDQIELLTRTFNLIKDVCQESSHTWISLPIEPPERLVN